MNFLIWSMLMQISWCRRVLRAHFFFFSADKDDINASFAGKKRNLVAMVVAHMAASDNIREILSEAVCFYAMHHKELENLE